MLETLEWYIALALLLSEALSFERAGVLASLWRHWCLDTTVVVRVERGFVFLCLSRTLRTELIASYPVVVLAMSSVLVK